MSSICVLCETPINNEAFRGMGDGSGQRFAHDGCYWRRLSQTVEKERDALKARVAQLEGALRESRNALVNAKHAFEDNWAIDWNCIDKAIVSSDYALSPEGDKGPHGQE